MTNEDPFTQKAKEINERIFQEIEPEATVEQKTPPPKHKEVAEGAFTINSNKPIRN